MLESNTFRSLMLILGVIIMGMALIFFFRYPVVKFDENNIENEHYNRLMLSEDKTELTPFDIALYYIKAKPRSDVRHY